MSDTVQVICWSTNEPLPDPIPVNFGVSPTGTGTIWLPHQDLAAPVDEAILHMGLVKPYEALFLRTQPRWFGFWAGPTLDKVQCEYIANILRGISFDAKYINDPIQEVCQLLERVLSGELDKLYVSMMPPGHIDFGRHTVFPHCPRCKREANLDRWMETYPIDPIECSACGQSYSPTSTAFSEPFELDFEEVILRL